MQEGGLKVCYTNCRSLRNKIDLLRGKACVENFDIIAVTEIWIAINSKNFVSEFKIEGYELFHEDRKGRRGREGKLARERRGVEKGCKGRGCEHGEQEEGEGQGDISRRCGKGV